MPLVAVGRRFDSHTAMRLRSCESTVYKAEYVPNHVSSSSDVTGTIVGVGVSMGV